MGANGVAPTRGYRVEIEVEEDGSYTVSVPDLPGCVAAAESPARAIALIGFAIDAWIESASADGADVPNPTRREAEYSGRFLLRLPRRLHRDAAVCAQNDGVSLNQWCVMAVTQAAALSAYEAATERIVRLQAVAGLVSQRGQWQFQEIRSPQFAADRGQQIVKLLGAGEALGGTQRSIPPTKGVPA